MKIISKILADRMAIILPFIISLEQSGFVKGQSIINNILLAHEMVQRLNANIRGNNFILKLDMAKACDRINWLFILKVFRQLILMNFSLIMFGDCFLIVGIL